MPNKQRTCKRRRVRKKSDGSLNQEDMEHNRKCEQKYMQIDNPWMKSILNNKKPKGYKRCKTCGGMVKMPCLLCSLEL